MTHRRGFVIALVVLVATAVILAVLYVKSHPLVFNESLWGHAHCMPQAGVALRLYASDHAGRLPSHTNGYGDALSLLREYTQADILTGPGYSANVFREAWASTSHVDEALCGRIYVQGLSETNDGNIALLFDKVAAPPDHCHFPRRLWAGFVREVCFIDGAWRAVPVEAWPDFAGKQIDLLVAAGFERTRAAELYAEVK